ncbi:MAG: DUF5004 domain-containing protein [Prevotella sp.]|jgi:hypothetical protein
MSKFKPIMKTSVLFCFMVTALLATSCSTVDDGDYVRPITLNEKIGGKWVLNSIVQTDESNAQTMPLTNLLDFDTFVINLDTDENDAPTTFSVEGNAPVLLPLKGTWTMDYDYTKSDATASQILLKSDAGVTRLTVTGVPGSDGILEYKFTRTVNGQPFVSYTYNLMSAVK